MLNIKNKGCIFFTPQQEYFYSASMLPPNGRTAPAVAYEMGGGPQPHCSIWLLSKVVTQLLFLPSAICTPLIPLPS